MASIIALITTTLQYGLQLGVLILAKNYYLYVIVMLATTALNNIITAAVTTKMYPAYKPIGKLEDGQIREINKKIKDMFTGKLGYVVLKYTDTLIISAFLGLTMLAVYQNYYFILTSVIGVIEIVFSAVKAGLGNSFITEAKSKQYADLEKFTFLLMWISGVCLCCFLGLYQPFMNLWVGQEYMLDMTAVICFAAYFYVYILNRLLNVYKDAAALWRQDRFRPLITAATNLVLNLLLVKIWGIYGVLLSTVVSWIAVGIPWIIQNVFSVFFDRSMMKGYIKQLLIYAVMAAISGVLVSWICLQIGVGGWGHLVLCAAVSVTIPNIVFWIAFRKNRLLRPSLQILDRMTKQKLHLERILLGEDKTRSA